MKPRDAIEAEQFEHDKELAAEPTELSDGERWLAEKAQYHGDTDAGVMAGEVLSELDRLRAENRELRALCGRAVPFIILPSIHLDDADEFEECIQSLEAAANGTPTAQREPVNPHPTTGMCSCGGTIELDDVTRHDCGKDDE